MTKWLLALVALAAMLAQAPPKPKDDPVARRFEALESRLLALERSLAAAPTSSLDGRLDRLDARLSRLEERALQTRPGDSGAILRLESRVQSLESQMARIQR
jgi:hypothetical protein